MMIIPAFQAFMNNEKKSSWHSSSLLRDKALIVAILLTALAQIALNNRRGLSQHEFSARANSVGSTTMLIGIFSITTDKAKRRREIIREHIILKDEKRVCSLAEFQRQVRDSPTQRKCQVAYTFVIGAGDENSPTDHWGDLPLTLATDQLGQVEEDCTYLSIRENMEDGKSPTFMKTAALVAKEYGLDYIAKTDDDSVVGLSSLIEYMDSDLPPAPYNTRTYGGSLVLSRAAKTQFVYAQGQFYFMSADVADHVGNVLTAEKRATIGMSIEDLDGIIRGNNQTAAEDDRYFSKRFLVSSEEVGGRICQCGD
jgi:hypothetical protein